MDNRQRALAASVAAGALFTLVQLGALALAAPFEDAGFQAVEDPQDPTNSLLYVGFLLVATAAMLLVIRLDRKRLLRAFLLGTSALLSWYVFVVPATAVADAVGISAAWLAAVPAAALGVVLYVHPEWYVLDAAGLVMGVAAAGLFGISFGLLPAILLLGALAVYDAIAVYRTEHMLDLASGVMELRLPIVLVFPLRLDYSFRDATLGDGDEDDGRDAFFIGLGDAVMPAIMTASAAFFLDTPALVAGYPLTLPALGALVGTLVGLAVLLRMVFRGRAHAGLPLLNGGAILGYLLAALAAGVSPAAALGL